MIRLLFVFLSTILCFSMSTSAFAYVNFAKEIKDEFYPKYPKPNYGTGKHAEQVKRGEYLAIAGDCISCHTDEKPGAKPYAGRRALIVPPFGTFYAPNITPDKETGIGKWTDKQFIEAMHNGINADGQNLYPVFPYVFFNRVTKKDLKDIKAYLNAIPAVKQKNKANKLPWPLTIRFFQYGWKILFFYPTRQGVFKPNPKKSDQWNRGAYLVQGLTHCSMCHTPHNILGAYDNSRYLGGAYVDNFWAPNITSAALHGYSVDDIVKVFRKGMLLGEQGQVLGPMQEANHNSLSRMTDSDLRAIAIYLKTVKPIEPKAAKTHQITPQAVREIYKVSCASCHDKGIEGAPIIGDEANWALREKKGLAKIIRHTITGYNQMPAMGTCRTCSKAQIRAVVEYMIAKSKPGFGKARDLMPITSPHQRKLTLKEGEQVFKQSCASCHANENNKTAPQIGDETEWQKRLKKHAPEELLHYAVKGRNNKHVRGGCTHCSNSEALAAAKYLLQKSIKDKDFSLW